MTSYSFRYETRVIGPAMTVPVERFRHTRNIVESVFSYLASPSAGRTLMHDNMLKIYESLPRDEAASFPVKPNLAILDDLVGLRSGDVTIEFKIWGEKDARWAEAPRGAGAPRRTIRIMQGLAAAVDEYIYPSQALVTLHEIQHLATAALFGDNITTPLGVGPTMQDGYGESGWAFEDQFVGGLVQTEWPVGEFGNFATMGDIVVTLADGKTYPLTMEYIANFFLLINRQSKADNLPVFKPATDAQELSPTLDSDSPLQRYRSKDLNGSRSRPTTPEKAERVKQGLGLMRVGRIPDRCREEWV